MKLFLASLGIGIIVPASLFSVVLFVKVLFPGTSTATAMFALYTFCWPIIFIRYIPGLTTTTMIVISFALGTLVDIVVVSLLAYFIFRATLTRRALGRVITPPQPPPFDHSL